MRLLEALLLIGITVMPFVKRPLIKRLPRYSLMAILPVVLILHLIVDGWRWQMVLPYVIVLFLSWRIWRASEEQPLNLIRILGFVLLVMLLVPGWLLPNLLPVFELPDTRGVYGVGTSSIYERTDMSEEITEDPSDRRELLYKIWYPTEDQSGPEDPYVDQANRQAFALKYGLPANALNYLDRVNTDTYVEAEPVAGSFPVLIFSPGYGSKSTGYYAIVRELVSQGYIVINMTHTYESLGVTFPDGRSVYFDYQFQGAEYNSSTYDINKMRALFAEGVPFDDRHQEVSEALSTYYYKHNISRWTQDILFTLDQLERWNQEGLLKGKMDLERIGVLGHSRGGGTAGNVPLYDDRVKAAANIDGISWGNKVDTIYHIPFLYISADWPATHEDLNEHVYLKKSTDVFYEADILGSAHSNFMDIPYMIPTRALSQAGVIDPDMAMEITTQLLVLFFDRHLKGATVSPMELNLQYESLKLQVFEGS